MKINSVEFIGSFEFEKQCPRHVLPEYAFIGRSNVGKSSLINMMMNRKDLARTSSTPGKTQTLNFYYIDESWYIVDLPGYGYAKTSKTNRAKWQKMIRRYLKNRESLYCLFVLLDARLPLQKVDKEFLDWIGENRIPFAIVYTKMDKTKKGKTENHTSSIQKELLQYWEELPTQFETSAEEKTGREEILSYISEINQK